MEYLSMSGGEDWVMRPVAKGLITYAELARNEVTILDLAIMNEFIDVTQENERRYHESINNE